MLCLRCGVHGVLMHVWCLLMHTLLCIVGEVVSAPQLHLRCSSLASFYDHPCICMSLVAVLAKHITDKGRVYVCDVRSRVLQSAPTCWLYSWLLCSPDSMMCVVLAFRRSSALPSTVLASARRMLAGFGMLGLTQPYGYVL
jgi:hypothetical protein